MNVEAGRLSERHIDCKASDIVDTKDLTGITSFVESYHVRRLLKRRSFSVPSPIPQIGK